ncbi:host attachment protein [Magnetospirillum sp. UT-4]|uniref:host attachment protein n=1 Tax=Magnetospirillum sp. UT-4 TaxID=2681467 RepID=UPI00137E35C4|nr:host attachment protein [Magnetospirillum sp. UT-4]CAA7618791.1 Protein required for attachment to host cells [Magnetospirillum sp. UT-4]
MAATPTWVLVADGARAQFYRDDKTALIPALDHDLAMPTRAHPRDVGSDRPGRSFDSAGEGRHAIEPHSDWKAGEKTLLARAVADELAEAARRHAFARLVLVAPPEMLGDLRRALDPAVRRMVTAEIGKDLTHLPAHAIRDHLGDVLRG